MAAHILFQLIEACKSLLNETGDEVWEEEGSSWITMDTFIVFLVGFSNDNMYILSWTTEGFPSETLIQSAVFQIGAEKSP